MEPQPKAIKIAAIVAFALAALSIVSDLTVGPVAGLAFALIPLFAGIGILRRQVWAASGLGIYLMGQAVLAPFILMRQQAETKAVVTVVLSAAIALALGIYFLRTGLALRASGANRGHAAPWLLLTALTTLPLIFVEAMNIPTGSMENTLLVGDHVLVQRVPRTNPALGDVIVFHYPVDPKQTFVKRIVGAAGDRIRIVNKVLYRNGKRIDEPWAVHKLDYMDPYRDNFPGTPNTMIFPPAEAMLAKNVVNGEVVVPAGKYFVLGDNRDQSLDSRYWGFVSGNEIIGKPVLIYDSADQTTEQAVASTPSLPRHTRWDRLFRGL